MLNQWLQEPNVHMEWTFGWWVNYFLSSMFEGRHENELYLWLSSSVSGREPKNDSGKGLLSLTSSVPSRRFLWSRVPGKKAGEKQTQSQRESFSQWLGDACFPGGGRSYHSSGICRYVSVFLICKSGISFQSKRFQKGISRVTLITIYPQMQMGVACWGGANTRKQVSSSAEKTKSHVFRSITGFFKSSFTLM